MAGVVKAADTVRESRNHPKCRVRKPQEHGGLTFAKSRVDDNGSEVDRHPDE